MALTMKSAASCRMASSAKAVKAAPAAKAAKMMVWRPDNNK